MSPEEWSLFAPVADERQFVCFKDLSTPKKPNTIASLKHIISRDGRSNELI